MAALEGLVQKGMAIPALLAERAWMVLPYLHWTSKSCCSIFFMFNWKLLSDFFDITRKIDSAHKTVMHNRPYGSPECGYKFMGKTFQAAQLTHERFLALDHSCEIFF